MRVPAIGGRIEHMLRIESLIDRFRQWGTGFEFILNLHLWQYRKTRIE